MTERPIAIAPDALHELQRERDHLVLLHEALADVTRAASLEARLEIFVEAIRRVGFGRVTLTLATTEPDEGARQLRISDSHFLDPEARSSAATGEALVVPANVGELMET